jgi:FeS assembly SUF system protein
LLERLLNRLYRNEEEDASRKDVPNANTTDEANPVDTSALEAHAVRRQEEKQETAEAGETAAESDDPIDTEVVRENIIAAHRTVFDPEIPVNIYDIGLIYEIKVEPTGMTYVQMTLTSPACPAAGILPGQIESATRSVSGVRDVNLDLTFDPPWNPEMMSEAARLELGLL